MYKRQTDRCIVSKATNEQVAYDMHNIKCTKYNERILQYDYPPPHQPCIQSANPPTNSCICQPSEFSCLQLVGPSRVQKRPAYQKQNTLKIKQMQKSIKKLPDCILYSQCGKGQRIQREQVNSFILTTPQSARIYSVSLLVNFCSRPISQHLCFH